MTNPVSAHINGLDPEFRETVQKLRQIFLAANAEIAEHIKWNSPAFFYTGEMKSFDPKEYRRDIAVINLHRGKILIVFPTGNKIDKSIGLKGKDYPDGRKIVTIDDFEHAEALSEVLTNGINYWMSRIEK